MSESKVEITGFVARNYDTLLNILSLGSYAIFIRRGIKKMQIQPADQILDLGCGTGRNSCLMLSELSPQGQIVGLDIGAEMIQQFKEKCQRYPNVQIQNLRIDEPLPFHKSFDKALLAFVFHGFPDEKKRIIIDNVKAALKPGGSLFILDYNEFDLERKSALFQKIFKKFECPLALGYLKIDWKKQLTAWGFHEFEEHFFYGKLVRLLKATL
ncbi:class I SAM-dependent methyltransferase [candidate division KSB1 bacterium]|nr:class I SAM-dependent methyltransferase [candidate division KSB1 bacterium]